MTDMHSQRIQRLSAVLKTEGLDLAAFVPGPNFYYFTGLSFHLMERPTLVFISSEGAIFGIIPELERQKWKATFPDAETFFWQDSDGYEAAFAKANVAMAGLSIGVEGRRMREFEASALRRNFTKSNVIDADDAISSLRLTKDESEVNLLSQAIKCSEVALAETLDQVRAGMTEKQIRSILMTRLLTGGADGIAFEPLVLTGGNAANPHGESGERRLAKGECLLFDFGAMIGGYNADMTRTVFCEHVTDEHADLYDAVLDANKHGRAVANPALTASDLDEAVTGVLKSSKFGEYVIHKTGHGLGLDVHENPQIMVGNTAQLLAGCFITIEPGLYKPDEIGVRIEDNVLLEAGGARSLTEFTREITIVGK